MANDLAQVTQQPLEDILKNGVDEGKCIAGKFKFLFHSTSQGKSTIVTIQSSLDVQSFRVLFHLEKDILQKLDEIFPSDSFRLSLRGCRMEKIAPIPRYSSLPMELVFSKGLHIEWKHLSSNELKVINTWPDIRDTSFSSDSWWLSQDDSRMHGDTGKRKCDSMESVIEDIPGTSSLINPPKPAKKRRKHMEGGSGLEEKSITIPTNNENTCQEIHKTPSTPHHHTTDAEQSMSEISKRKSPLQKSDSRQEGLHSQHKLIKMHDISPGRCPLLIGMVTQIDNIEKTSTGEWRRLVHLVDSTNCRGPGLKINFFSKQYAEWLPHVALWDVLILRDVIIKEWSGGLNGVGYNGRLQWAAFSPKDGCVYHTKMKKDPREARIGSKNGDGALFTPFYQPISADIQDCINLSNWWRDFTKQNAVQKPNDKPVQLDSFRPVSRMHRLISEANPLAPPNGYFDCTVEVIHGTDNGNCYTLWVTDYTQNSQASTVSYKWCPRILSDMVVPFELWDGASSMGPSLKAGHYYHIQNARMRINAAGLMEGKVFQTKIKQLFADLDTNNAELSALLERKRLVEQGASNEDTTMAYTLLQDVVENNFFNCTVELLHIAKSAGKRPCLYVTDYTSHAKLSGSTDESWSNGLDGKILKVILSEEQEAVAGIVEKGALYCMKKLRLKHSIVEDCFCVILGGSDKLIVPLNANRTDNEHLNGLLRRKEQCQRSPKPSELEASTTRQGRQQQPLNIKDIARDSTKHKIDARVVDFHPFDLKDAFIQWCTRCEEMVPKEQRACNKCGDSDHEFIQYLFQLHIMVEDYNHEQIMVLIDDKSSFLAGLRRGCLTEDTKALSDFGLRLKPIIGNLTMVHSGMTANKVIEVESPFLSFELSSWQNPVGGKVFALENCTPACR